MAASITLCGTSTVKREWRLRRRSRCRRTRSVLALTALSACTLTTLTGFVIFGLPTIVAAVPSLRHTAITNLVQAGVGLPTIQTISGHKTLAMVLRYAHVHGTHVDEAVAAIGRALPGSSGNKTPTQLHRNYTRRSPR